MKIGGVIFDLDGTLVDSGLDFAAMRREMDLEDGTPILEAIAALPDADRRDACWTILDRHEREAAERATVIPGVHEFLARLSRRNIPQAVLTRNSRRSTTRVLSRLGLTFSHVLTREDAPPKPDPAGVLAICSRWQTPAQDVIFVGDYLYDIHCGRRAGVRTILFAPNGRPHYSSLADHCVPSFFDAGLLVDRLLEGLSC